MFSSNYTNRLFGRTRGRSKKKINLKNYYETVHKYKFKNFKEKSEYILDVGTGYGETISEKHRSETAKKNLFVYI